MIRSSLKKMGKAYSMNIEKTYAWGKINNYMFMLDESSNCKRISICLLSEEDDKKREILLDYIETNKAYYKITSYKIDETYISFYFYNTVELKKRMIEFIDNFSKKLKENNVSGANICCVCQKQDNQELKNVKTENAVLCMHQNCFDSLSQQINKNIQSFEDEKKNHLWGAIGASIGGLIGAIPWIVAYMYGFFVGWLGFLIGITANKGYSIFKGKNSKMKPYIIIIVVIMCVITAQLLSEYISLNNYLIENYTEKFTINEMTEIITTTISDSSEYRFEIIKNLSIGLLFAGLGIFKLIKSISSQSKVPFEGMRIIENQQLEYE